MAEEDELERERDKCNDEFERLLRGEECDESDEHLARSVLPVRFTLQDNRTLLFRQRPQLNGTADDLGFDLWRAATVMGHLLEKWWKDGSIGFGQEEPSAPAPPMLLRDHRTVVELGCGLGVVGCVCGALMETGHVYLTDLAHVCPRAQKNADINQPLCSAKIHVTPLAWGVPCAGLLKESGGIDLVVGADVVSQVYDPVPLVHTLMELSARHVLILGERHDGQSQICFNDLCKEAMGEGYWIQMSYFENLFLVEMRKRA